MSTRRAGLIAALALTTGAVMTGGLGAHAAAVHNGQKTVQAKEISGKYVFSRSKITVKVGTKVWWVNTTDAAHTVTSKSAGWTYDKQLATSKKLGFVFHKAGTFRYFCKYHSGMVGTVVVQM